jgi:hypothetical protein
MPAEVPVPRPLVEEDEIELDAGLEARVEVKIEVELVLEVMLIVETEANAVVADEVRDGVYKYSHVN